MMNSSVHIAGVGVISAIGNNVAECLSSFEKEQAGMADIAYLETLHRKKIPVAEVKLSNNELAARSGMASHLSRNVLLSALAATEAINDAGIENMHRWRTGFVSANTVGGLDKSEQFMEAILHSPTKGRLKDVVHHECGSVTELVADHLGIKNYVSTVSTACSSSANAVFFGARLIKHGIQDVVVAGGTDTLTRFTLNGFNTLMILDRQLCKPFDENRNGLNLGEGAGYLVLVSDRVAESMKSQLYCKLSGYCNKNDAYHQTASSPNGTGSYLAMNGALELAGLQPGDIDYINLHGTGTQNNDLAEGIAIKRLFDGNYPKMSSTKSFTGHTLGASGAIEAVFSALSVKHGMIYPNLRLEHSISEFPFVPERRFLKNQIIDYVLSNSFGFGGNCSSLIFSKIAG